MFGFTSSGCFIIGVIFGFILAAILAVGAVFFFNTDLRREGITYVESFWSKVKNSVDDSIDAAKKAPTVEPEVPLGASSTSKPAGSSQGTPAAPAPPQSRPRIEIKLGI